MKKFIIAACFFMLIAPAFVKAQFRKIPDSVTNALKQKYPNAENVSWSDKITNFTASFSIKGLGYDARFDSKGTWIDTKQTVNKDYLPKEVLDGFQKSKFADWDIKTVYFIYQPDKPIEYHMIVGKNEVQKVHLLFDPKGQLIKDEPAL